MQRASCLDRRLADHSLTRGDLTDLEEQAERRPESVAAVLKAALQDPESKPGEESERSDLLELYARVLQRLGKNDEAAAAWLDAVHRDPGTESFTWRNEQGKVLWEVDASPGTGRLLRAAEGLAAMGYRKAALEATARALAAGGEDDARRLWRALGGGAVPALDPEPTPLTTAPGFPTAPDVTLKILGGGERTLSSLRGNVALLDFWASWCPPCMAELPAIEALYRKDRERGLAVVAVNAQELEPAVRKAVERLGLTMPVARYDGEMDRAFHVRSLPVLILLDRDGRIRAHWSGYRPQLIRSLPRMVDQLLGADPEGAPQRVAEVRAGAGRFDVMWSVVLPAPVTGMAVLPAADDGTPSVAAVARGSLVTMDARGRKLAEVKVPPGVRRIRAAADGSVDLVGFRTAARDVVVLDPAAGEEGRWRAPHPVLDVAVEGKKAAVATSGGCYLLSLPNGPGRMAGGTGETRSVKWVAGDAGPELLVLKEERWIRLRPDGTTVGQGIVPRNDRRVLATAERIGTGPGKAPAVLARGFLDGGASGLVLAGGERELIVVSADDGRVRYRCRWGQPILDLEAADLDGDGADEVLVGSLGRVTVLKRAHPRSEHEGDSQRLQNGKNRDDE